MSKLVEEFLREAKQLCSGIFWIISDNYDLSDYKLLTFPIPCSPEGKIDSSELSIELNSKKGNSYNHKKIWEETVKNNNQHKPYNKEEYNYYPRGRVEIAHNKATIFLNPNINKPDKIEKIKHEFGLFSYNIPEINVINDGSSHYKCFLDD